jgi:hypothetical protein
MKCSYAPQVAWRKVAGEVVVLDPRASLVHGLNPAGGRVWLAIPDSSTFAGLAAAAGEASADEIAAFLGELASTGLVTLEDVAGAPGDGAEKRPDAPAISWSEELRTFVANCAPIPGQPLCNPQPAS